MQGRPAEKRTPGIAGRLEDIANTLAMAVLFVIALYPPARLGLLGMRLGRLLLRRRLNALKLLLRALLLLDFLLLIPHLNFLALLQFLLRGLLKLALLLGTQLHFLLLLYTPLLPVVLQALLIGFLLTAQLRFLQITLLLQIDLGCALDRGGAKFRRLPLRLYGSPVVLLRLPFNR